MSGLTELRKALFNKSTENEAKSLLDQIKRHADPQRQAGMRETAPTELKVYGVRVPHLRKIARAWQRAHKQTAREDLVALVETLWNGESREERVLATHLLECYQHWVPDLTRAHFERWRRGLDNWEMADGLGWALALWLLGSPPDRQPPAPGDA